MLRCLSSVLLKGTSMLLAWHNFINESVKTLSLCFFKIPKQYHIHKWLTLRKLNWFIDLNLILVYENVCNKCLLLLLFYNFPCITYLLMLLFHICYGFIRLLLRLSIVLSLTAYRYSFAMYFQNNLYVECRYLTLTFQWPRSSLTPSNLVARVTWRLNL